MVHPRSLEIFESLDSSEVSRRGLQAASHQDPLWRQTLGTMDPTCGSVYGFNLGLSEEVTESILTDYLLQQGGAVNRSSRLVGLTPMQTAFWLRSRARE